jgi:hypothetical protein
MNIKKEHIAYKKSVGKLNGKEVIELATTGGLHMLIHNKGANPEVLAAAPHPAIARHIASKREPEVVFTELSKSDYMEPYLYVAMVPEYERMTDYIRSVWSK